MSDAILQDGQAYRIFWLRQWGQTGTRLFVNGMEQIVYGDTDWAGTTFYDKPIYIGVQNGDGDGAPSVVDCDDFDPGLNLDDADGDGATSCEGDCDDTDPARAPALLEICDDGVDNDCDAATPDLFDADGDGSDCSADCDDAEGFVCTNLSTGGFCVQSCDQSSDCGADQVCSANSDITGSRYDWICTNSR